jgi:hypothetical protein
MKVRFYKMIVEDIKASGEKKLLYHVMNLCGRWRRVAGVGWMFTHNYNDLASFSLE